jgi:hypothetical protein
VRRGVGRQRPPQRGMMAVRDQHPKPRHRRNDVPDGFIPVDIIDDMGRRVT